MHRFLICKSETHVFGVPVSRVRDILPIGPTNALPAAPKFVRGLGAIRGRLSVLLDLRLLLGLPSRAEQRDERVRNFRQRRQDHIDWLTELEASLAEDRPFRKTTDPHACAFGRWYDAYRSPDPVLNLKLRAFDAPHKRIHELGVAATRLAADGRSDEARALVRGARDGDLAALLRLFDDTEPALRSEAPEVTILLDRGTSPVGLVVDEVHELAELASTSRADAETNGRLFPDLACLDGVAQHGTQAVFLLSPDQLPTV